MAWFGITVPVSSIDPLDSGSEAFDDMKPEEYTCNNRISQYRDLTVEIFIFSNTFYERFSFIATVSSGRIFVNCIKTNAKKYVCFYVYF